MPERKPLPDWPGLMTAELAAAYCGFGSVERFREKCTVRARRIGEGQRDRRWLREELDDWSKALPFDGDAPAVKDRPITGADWIARLDGDDGEAAPRQGL